MGAPVIGAVGVVVPARDEAALLGACLDALDVAAAAGRRAGVEVRVVVVADRCTDRTADLARRHPATAGGAVLEIDAGSVGAARRAGVSRVLTTFAAMPRRSLWLATTDADSRVAPGWVRSHLELAARGHHAVAGTVVVDDWGERSAATARRYEAAYRAGVHADGHDHVHGASLGVRADAYLAVGGFPPLALGEDRGLWDALRGTGRPVATTAAAPVVTSARRCPRAVGGFAAHLDGLEALRAGPA